MAEQVDAWDPQDFEAIALVKAQNLGSLRQK